MLHTRISYNYIADKANNDSVVKHKSRENGMSTKLRSIETESTMVRT